MHEQLKSATRCQRVARPTVTFPVEGITPHPFDQYQFVLLWGAVSSYRVKVFFREL